MTRSLEQRLAKLETRCLLAICVAVAGCTAPERVPAESIDASGTVRGSAAYYEGANEEEREFIENSVSQLREWARSSGYEVLGVWFSVPWFRTTAIVRKGENHVVVFPFGNIYKPSTRKAVKRSDTRFDMGDDAVTLYYWVIRGRELHWVQVGFFGEPDEVIEVAHEVNWR